MKRLTLKEALLGEQVNTEVKVMGWVRSIRKSKAFCFIILNDGSCQKNLQIIVDDIIPGYENFSTALAGTSMSIKGKLVHSGGKNQGIEMQGSHIEILGECDDSYPLQKKGTSLEFLRDVAHLRSRTNTFGAIFRVRHALAMATHQFFDKKGYYYLNSPIITGNDCEGAGELFQVTTLPLSKLPHLEDGKLDYTRDYFNKPTFLTVSGQLEGETHAMGLGAVYTFGPTFRSENSQTARHLSEFWMIEPEVAFAHLEDVADLAAEYIKFLISYSLENCKDELEFLNQRPRLKKGKLGDSPNGKIAHLEVLKTVRDSEFVHITYTKAIEILEQADEKFEYSTKWGEDLQTEHERFLTEKHFKSPVIVTDYPKEIKSFYMKTNQDGKTVRAMDVLVPGVGEIIGGSEREDRLDILIANMKEKGIDQKGLDWYLDLRRFGTAPHSGFGLGFERAVMYITGMSNIRDVIPFPRTPRNCEF